MLASRGLGLFADGDDLCARALPLMEGRLGSIVTLTYIGGERVGAELQRDGASRKGALEAAYATSPTTSVPRGIRVNAISAGPNPPCRFGRHGLHRDPRPHRRATLRCVATSPPRKSGNTCLFSRARCRAASRQRRVRRRGLSHHGSLAPGFWVTVPSQARLRETHRRRTARKLAVPHRISAMTHALEISRSKPRATPFARTRRDVAHAAQRSPHPALHARRHAGHGQGAAAPRRSNSGSQFFSRTPTTCSCGPDGSLPPHSAASTAS
jgi:hypothetical protein